MMKKLLFITALTVLSMSVNAQTSWVYDFGNSTGSISSGSNIVNSDGTSSGTAFLPKPQENPDESLQSARVRLPSDGTGSFEFVNSGISLGSGSRLLIKGGTSTSKFSIYNFQGTNVASVSFKVRFNEFTAGQWIFAVGKNDGTNNTYSGNSALPSTESEVFAGLRWANQEDGSIRFYSRTDGATWSTNNRYVFNFDTDYKIEVLCNNSVNTATYDKEGQEYSINAYSYHVWVNNTRIETAANNYNFAKGGLAEDATLTDLFFYGVRSSSSSTVYPTAYVDDFLYANYLTELTLPVTLSSFTAQKQNLSVQLNWSTVSEQNNSHFDIERSADGKSFNVIGTKNGEGNSSVQQNYSFTDNNPQAGVNYYRLVQYDFDGKTIVYEPKAVDMGVEGLSLKVFARRNLSEIKISIHSDEILSGQFLVYSAEGRKIIDQDLQLNSGVNVFGFNTSVLKSGIYVASYRSGNKIVTEKFVN